MASRMHYSGFGSRYFLPIGQSSRFKQSPHNGFLALHRCSTARQHVVSCMGRLQPSMRAYLLAKTHHHQVYFAPELVGKPRLKHLRGRGDNRSRQRYLHST